MKAKLDENLGRRGVMALERFGWNVATVSQQGLSGACDGEVIRVCADEGRVLISLDKGFANPLVYKPRNYPGIVVLRLPEPLTIHSIENALERVGLLAISHSPIGRLWIADHQRIREYTPEDSPS